MLSRSHHLLLFCTSSIGTSAHRILPTTATMNLDHALVFLLASLNSVSSFAPGCTTPRLSLSAIAHQKTRVGSTLFSDVGDATATEVASAVASDTASIESSVNESSDSEYDVSMYVGNVPFEVTENEIRDAFSSHGQVKKITLPLDKNTNRPRGFAFVQMSNADETASAIAALNESELAGRTIYVSESLPKEKLRDSKKKSDGRKKKETAFKIYVGNVSFDTTAETLQETFSQYGKVNECIVPLDFDGNPRGFAFVAMDEESGLKAIDALNGLELDGRTITVNKSVPKEERKKPPQQQQQQQMKLYVGNLSWGTEEGALRELFGEYGRVIDCYIPLDRETGQHRGFAFVTMNPDDALRAADETDGYELDGRILRVNEAQAKGGFSRSYDNNGYGSGNSYDDAENESWDNNAY